MTEKLSRAHCLLRLLKNWARVALKIILLSASTSKFSKRTKALKKINMFTYYYKICMRLRSQKFHCKEISRQMAPQWKLFLHNLKIKQVLGNFVFQIGQMIIEANSRKFVPKCFKNIVNYVVFFAIKAGNISTWRHLAGWIFNKSDSLRCDPKLIQ